MSFWAALGQAFLLLFEPPVISPESLRNGCLKKHYTVKNVCFGLFWGTVFSIGTSYGVWPWLWGYLLVDAHTFCEYAPCICDHVRLILVFIMFAAGTGFAVAYLYAKRPHDFERIHKIVEGSTSYAKSLYEVKILACLVKVLPLFMKQLRMNYFLSRVTDDDGEIVAIEAPEEKPQSKKPKMKFGVPKSIRDQKKQAIESAQTAVNKPTGNPVEPMKKK
ncbi:hypothetical protein BKA64DRAFT_224405 [Cadophora sp. MPI-SDFR-AT-0126]|nr:hypothetical protein BKA64DRAFT_224405 [Leotiomycetes sp. MPI-SDFR-AT-0126]